MGCLDKPNSVIRNLKKLYMLNIIRRFLIKKRNIYFVVTNQKNLCLAEDFNSHNKINNIYQKFTFSQKNYQNCLVNTSSNSVALETIFSIFLKDEKGFNVYQSIVESINLKKGGSSKTVNPLHNKIASQNKQSANMSSIEDLGLFSFEGEGTDDNKIFGVNVNRISSDLRNGAINAKLELSKSPIKRYKKN